MNDTREYIIDKAYGLFLNRSYEAVSISEISKEIGFTKGALYHHFASKEDLFKAVINKYLPLEKLCAPEAATSLEHFIDDMLKTAEKIVNEIYNTNKGFLPLSYLALLIDAFRHYPEYAKEQDQMLRIELEKIKNVLSNAINSGEIRNDVNVEFMAMNFFSLSTGIAINLLQNNSPALAIDLLRNQLYELYKMMKV